MDWGTTDKVKLGDLIAKVEKGELLLPDFQRDYGWGEGQITSLIATLLAQYPAGSLMFWNTKRDTVKTRTIEGAPDDSNSGNHPTLVLDGQQRLTSLWQALHPAPNAKYRFFLQMELVLEAVKARAAYQGASDADPRKRDLGSWAEKLDDAVLYAKQRSKKLSGVDAFYTRDEQISASLMPVSFLSDAPSASTERLKWLQDWVKAKNASEEDLTALFSFTGDFLKYEFPGIYLNESISLDAVCKIFETVNSKAMVLDPYDLLTAKWFHKIKLRDLWASVDQDVKDDLGNEPYLLLQTHALVITANKLGTIKQDGSAPSSKRSTIMNLEPALVGTNWGKVVSASEVAIHDLRDSCGWTSPSTLPYPPILATMIAWRTLVADLPKTRQATAIDFARRHYFAAVFSQDYDQGSQTKMGRDIKALAASLRNDSLDSEPLHLFKREGLEDQVSTRTIRAKAVLGSVLLMVSGLNAQDFYGGSAMFSKGRLQPSVDVHHIFPKQFLKDTGVPENQWDLVANLTFLLSSTNKSIKALAPSLYLQRIEQNLPVKQLDSLLRRHLISGQALQAMRNDNYSDFRAARAATVASFAEALVNGDSFQDALAVVG
jgi:hypothetical protein